MLRAVITVIAVGLCTLFASCHETKPADIFISVDEFCKLLNARGEEINEVNLENNQLVEWRNNSDVVVKFVVTDPNVLSGRNSVRVEPGHSVVIRVAAGKARSFLAWHCGENGGDGGGNTPVNNGGGGSGGGSL